MMIKKKIKYISEESEDSETEIKKLKDKLKTCQKDKEEYLTQVQRARADLVNYRRRQEEKVLPEFIAMGQAIIINGIVLPVLDSLEAGAKKNEDVKRIKDQMEGVLNKHNIKEIKAVGEKFNPEFHEAMEQVESDQEQGIIIEEVQKGYLLNNKVLRISKVKVSK